MLSIIKVMCNPGVGRQKVKVRSSLSANYPDLLSLSSLSIRTCVRHKSAPLTIFKLTLVFGCYFSYIQSIIKVFASSKCLFCFFSF